jgi:hypothetical protein
MASLYAASVALLISSVSLAGTPSLTSVSAHTAEVKDSQASLASLVYDYKTLIRSDEGTDNLYNKFLDLQAKDQSAFLSFLASDISLERQGLQKIMTQLEVKQTELRNNPSAKTFYLKIPPLWTAIVVSGTITMVTGHQTYRQYQKLNKMKLDMSPTMTSACTLCPYVDSDDRRYYVTLDSMKLHYEGTAKYSEIAREIRRLRVAMSISQLSGIGLLIASLYEYADTDSPVDQVQIKTDEINRLLVRVIPDLHIGIKNREALMLTLSQIKKQ